MKETRDQGKTWRPESSDRPNRPGPVAQPPTPEQIAAQQASAAEAQKRADANAANDRGLAAQKLGDLATAQGEFEAALALWNDPAIRENLGDNCNRLGLEAQKRGDHAAAEREFERALANWDHPVIRKNLENVRAQTQERRQREQEFRDAPMVAKMHEQLQQFGAQIGNAPGKFNFDGAPGAGTTAMPSGLDFEGLPAKTSAMPIGAAGVAITTAREVNGDPMVVDLRDAKALVVDPMKVAGELPPAAVAQPVASVAERAEQAKAVFTATNPAEQTKARDQLRDALNADLRQASRVQSEAHHEMMDDMRMLHANGQVYTDALVAAQQRIRAKELAALKAAEQRNAQDIATELERVRKGGNYDPKRCDELLAWLRNAQAGILRDGYQEMAAEVARLRQQLVVATKGQPIIPINPESQDLLEDLFFPESSQSVPDLK